MKLKYIILAAFLGCGDNGHTSGKEDVNNPCPDMSHNNGRDMDQGSDMNKREKDMMSYDSGRNCPDMGVDSSRDSGLEDRLDLGVDSGDSGVDYPIARLICTEFDPDDGLCIHRPRVDREYCWDFSPSEAGPGRELVSYRFFPDVVGFPEFNIDDFDPCFVYGARGLFSAYLEVEDNIGDYGGVDFYNDVGD